MGPGSLSWTAGPFISQPVEHAIANPWPTLTDEALHGLAGEMVRLYEPHTEAAPVVLLVSFLSEVGVMLGRAQHLILDGGYHLPCSGRCWWGKSSKSRKGMADKRIESFCQHADPVWTRGECRDTLSSGEKSHLRCPRSSIQRGTDQAERKSNRRDATSSRRWRHRKQAALSRANRIRSRAPPHGTRRERSLRSVAGRLGWQRLGLHDEGQPDTRLRTSCGNSRACDAE